MGGGGGGAGAGEGVDRLTSHWTYQNTCVDGSWTVSHCEKIGLAHTLHVRMCLHQFKLHFGRYPIYVVLPNSCTHRVVDPISTV